MKGKKEMKESGLEILLGNWYIKTDEERQRHIVSESAWCIKSKFEF